MRVGDFIENFRSSLAPFVLLKYPITSAMCCTDCPYWRRSLSMYAKVREAGCGRKRHKNVVFGSLGGEPKRNFPKCKFSNLK